MVWVHETHATTRLAGPAGLVENEAGFEAYDDGERGRDTPRRLL